MIIYSNLIAVYKWLTATYITATAIWATAKDAVHSKTLMCGILIFDCSLVMDRVLPLHEPIITGWFPELAGFVLVLSLGVAIGQEVAASFTKSAVMEERAHSMERLSQMQKTYYPIILEKAEEAKTARHDLRHHFVAIAGLLDKGQYDKLRGYLAQYGASIRQSEPISYCRNDVANVLAHHYARLAKAHGIELTMALDIACDLNVSDADLCGLLSNLLENAMEACLRLPDGRRFITLSVMQKKTDLAIRMENSGGDIYRSGGGFLSSKTNSRKGYGLESIRVIARRYSGAAEFDYNETAQIFTSTVLLTSPEPAPR